MFSPLHEARHIISDILVALNPEFIPPEPWQIEAVCEQFAAAVFMPADWFGRLARVYKLKPRALHKAIGCGYQAQLIRLKDVFSETFPLMACIYDNAELLTHLEGPDKPLSISSTMRRFLEQPEHYRLTTRVITAKMCATELDGYYIPAFSLREGSAIAECSVASAALRERADVYSIRWPMTPPPRPAFDGGRDLIVDAFVTRHFGVISKVISVAVPHGDRQAYHLMNEPWGVQRQRRVVPGL